jgi:transposase
MTTRKKYPKEFKLDAISLVLDQGYSRSEAARSLDINANMLCRWIKEYQSEDGQAFRGNGILSPEQAEIRQLKEENRRLKMEKEILKKATVCVL